MNWVKLSTVTRLMDPDRRQLAVTCAGGQGDGAGQDCQISSGMRGQKKGREGGGKKNREIFRAPAPLKRRRMACCVRRCRSAGQAVSRRWIRAGCEADGAGRGSHIAPGMRAQLQLPAPAQK